MSPTTTLLLSALLGHPVPHAGAPAPVERTVTLVAGLPARAALRVGHGAASFETVPGWCRLPDARPLGNTHGTIAIDRAGLVYYNTDTDRAIMVHRPDGSFARSFAAECAGIHDMQLREEDGIEYLYAAHLGGKRVIKMTLDGTIVLTIGCPLESGKYGDDPSGWNPTAVAVAPSGDIYVADGYGRNWIHRFRADGAYVSSFGGPGEAPGTFRTCHGMVVDTRGDRPLLLVCDRENRRLQRFDLEGAFVDVVATGLRRPCGVSIRGDETAVAELEGRVTLLDRNFAVVAHLGDNPDRRQWAQNGVPPEQWVDGIFTAPHGCCFDGDGNLYVMDWNATGRITKLRRVDVAVEPDAGAVPDAPTTAPARRPD